MKLWERKIAKLTMVAIMCLAVSCTFRIEVPPIQIVNTAQETKAFDASKAFGSVAMVALQPIGRAESIGIGTAFAISNNELLTAGHVCTAINGIRTAGKATGDIWLVYVGRSDQLAKRRGAKIKAIDSVNDLCELELQNHGLAPLKIADYNTVKLGDNTYIVGAPSGVMISISEGKVMNPITKGLSVPEINNRIAVSSAATGGHSGSPILNDRGEVIGMLVIGHTSYDHLSFGVPIPIIVRFMKFADILGG